MIRNIDATLLVFLYSSVLSGCSSTVQSLTLKTNPPGTSCSLSRDGVVLGVVNPTPGELQIDRSRHALSVLCQREGYQDGTKVIQSGISRNVFLNIIQGDVGALGVDAVTGADNAYDHETTIDLLPEVVSENSQPAGL